MLASIRPSYPIHLLPVREAVLPHPRLTDHERKRLSACRFNDACSLSICPSCCRKQGFLRKLDLLKSAAQMPVNRLKFATLTSRDVALAALMQTAQTMVKAGRNTLRRLSVTGYALKLEVSQEPWSDLHHAHLHTIVDSPPAGRKHISAGACEAMWLATLPGQLHPLEGGSHIKRVRDLADAADYLAKSPYAGAQTEAEIERVVDVLLATRGSAVQKFTQRGSIAAAA